MDSKKTVIIAWRFASKVSDVLLDSHYIKLKTIGDGLIPEEKFQELLQELENATSDLTAFVHEPNFNDDKNRKRWKEQIDKLKKYTSRDKNIYVLSFSGGNSAVHRELIDQDESALKKVPNEDITIKIRKCVQELDVVPRLIQLHKRLILAKLWDAEVNNKLLKDIVRDDESFEDTIDIVRENVEDLSEGPILNYISTEVATYGA